MATHAHSAHGLPDPEFFCTSCGARCHPQDQACQACGAPTIQTELVHPRHLKLVTSATSFAPPMATPKAGRVRVLLVVGLSSIILALVVASAAFFISANDRKNIAAKAAASEAAALETSEDIVEPVLDAHKSLARELDAASGRFAPAAMKEAQALESAVQRAEGTLSRSDRDSPEMREALDNVRDVLSASTTYAVNVKSVIRTPQIAETTALMSNAESVIDALEEIDGLASESRSVRSGAESLMKWAPNARQARANAAKARAAKKAKEEAEAAALTATPPSTVLPIYNRYDYRSHYGYGYPYY